MTSTDRDVLERFADIVQNDIAPSHVIKPVVLLREATGNNKAQYRWTNARRVTVRLILAEFRPWFGERRAAKCDEAIEWLDHLGGPAMSEKDQAGRARRDAAELIDEITAALAELRPTVI